MRAAVLIIIFAGVLFSGTSFAESDKIPPQAPVDPANVVAPDLVFIPTKRDTDHYWEYFYFHKLDVSYDGAFADLSECTGYSQTLVATGPIPKFVPLGGGGVPVDINLQFGLVGAVAYGFVAGIINHDVERSNLRRCMAYKGYKRYGLNRAIWDKLAKGTDLEVTTRLAKTASGPKPSSEEIAP